MESFFYTLHVSPVHDSIHTMFQHIPYVNNSFHINLDYTNTIIEPYARNTASLSIITIKDTFVVPLEIVCNCLERDLNIALYHIFSFLPSYILDSIIPKVEQYARQMVANNNVLEMNLSLRVTTGKWAEKIEDLLEILEINHPCYDSKEKCSICLEEFCTSSKSEIVHTKCSHFFHKDCIVPWIQSCVNSSSSCSCPLCRGQIL
uniref:Probable E3 ubiquitin-protein ligase RHC2A n=1 Tax=Cicer arietinum TaxID=3827 RepID=A0A1S3DV44_CICAR|nr:probable E3 ubiquitin-protein ligase RHC2A [Cicer arietinum]